MSHIHAWQIIVLIILAGGMLYSRRQRVPGAVPIGGRDGGATKKAAKPAQTSEEAYADLRRQALATDPKTLFLAGELKPDEAYGLLMEMGISDSVVTLACFADGDARVLYKSGGGMIGGLSHESVRKAAKELVALAQKALPRMTRTTTHPVPAADRIRFYVLTRRGVFTIEASRQAVGGQSELSTLFQSGQEVVAQMRQVEAERSQPTA